MWVLLWGGAQFICKQPISSCETPLTGTIHLFMNLRMEEGSGNGRRKCFEIYYWAVKKLIIYSILLSLNPACKVATDVFKHFDKSNIFVLFIWRTVIPLSGWFPAVTWILQSVNRKFSRRGGKLCSYGTKICRSASTISVPGKEFRPI